MFKVWVQAVGSSTYATNGLVFDTVKEADKYGFDLMMRWFGADNYVILPAEAELVGFLDVDTVNEKAVSA